ncbi:UDP-N-acetylglucosamine 2-epimerase (non-hydrolyzing) [Candidatus Dependentiae bacterium]|nr:UDP-N-acetylglucosamine 2-epimerase (non-hydrolyzing) [Candidatus Dependentiae bacterium]
MKSPVVVVVGTRPDAIKLLPIYAALKQQQIPTLLCATHQHVQMLDQVLHLFNTPPDTSLNVMVAGQSLSHITAAVLQRIQTFYEDTKPFLVVVQGDTTTSLAASMAAFYQGIPVAHIEAGLRTYDKQSPFPEEMNRVAIGQLAQYHFAPTPLNVAALLHEGVPYTKVHCVGNTVVDALQHVQTLLHTQQVYIAPALQQVLDGAAAQKKKIVLVTTHRRESFGAGLLGIMQAVKTLATQHADHLFILPMHLNPVVRDAITATQLTSTPGVVCVEPLAYHELVSVLERAAWVMTDSGGIQEEALCLGKRVVVMREKTERVELLWEGRGILSGTTEKSIVVAAHTIMQHGNDDDNHCYVYGDGQASQRIASILKMGIMAASAQ